MGIHGTTPDGVKLPADRLGKRAGRVVIGVYLDDTLMDALNAATRAAETARDAAERARQRAALPGAPDDAVDAAAALAAAADKAEAARDAAQEALDDGTLWLTFRSLGRQTYRDLIRAHPPTETDHEQARAQGQGAAAYDFEGFAPAIVQAACASPVLTDDDIDAMFRGDSWSDGDISAVFTAAITAQIQSRTTATRRHPG